MEGGLWKCSNKAYKKYLKSCAANETDFEIPGKYLGTIDLNAGDLDSEYALELLEDIKEEVKE